MYIYIYIGEYFFLVKITCLLCYLFYCLYINVYIPRCIVQFHVVAIWRQNNTYNYNPLPRLKDKDIKQRGHNNYQCKTYALLS